ncbi:hypothetical protein LPMP_100720 [Leishmania panamensis]|uniref:ZC3H15/TMA46 family C-terminal domain-containing protein n=6 Tax=Viannia TaxID=37616 RepID=A4H667_LEIBR|nr:conserved hypothetical protein [Leishmania braziliensis MHOM/BR/75/M2904]XP_010696795.1 hypothetical protein LPMP_100720 [Leishmania panamensis]KAI5686010.1 DRG Family Regulatory Protein [Leishmania braziliensis]CCM13519.1 hypothetical protein, conserved [Leishmania guyanensis]AIN96142.1 hypothetical protein LPMP_100720 [Leishmania panamensis]CAJ2467877.1 unnamed protein product [Leishmania braziliensis]CAJ2468441.1 unnamed protein product [Leishmania braziliensis]
MGKAEQKKKEKIVEDKTFGLKNKNRSAKVQAYVQQVRQSVDQRNPQERKSQSELAARRSAKEEKRAREAELAKLFNDVDQQQRKKLDGAKVEAADGDDQYMCNPEEYLFRPEDFDEVEKDDERLEEKLEAEREKLKDRTDLTPVTEVSFQAWKQRKREEAAEMEAARVRRAKSGDGKLRGWDLWQMDQELFVDDENADEFYEREALEDLEGGEEEAAFDLS